MEKNMGLISLAGKFRDQAAKRFSDRDKPYWLTRLFNSDARLKRVMDLLTRIPEGRTLLEFAKEYKIEIHLMDRMNSRGVYFAPSTTDTGEPSSIHLNSCMSITNIAITLAHELRHAWQHHRLAVGTSTRLNFSPILTLVFGRLIEGDAYAFTRAIAAKIEKLTRTYIAQPENISLPFGQSWRKDFDDFQKSERASNYDVGALKTAAMSTSHKIASASELASFHRILVEGLSTDAPGYIDYGDNEHLAQNIISNISPEILHRAQNIPVCPPLEWF
jgi:hypothetical protein